LRPNRGSRTSTPRSRSVRQQGCHPGPVAAPDSFQINRKQWFVAAWRAASHECVIEGMRLGRMKISGWRDAVYHCMTRTVNVERLFGEREKEVLRFRVRYFTDEAILGFDGVRAGLCRDLADGAGAEASPEGACVARGRLGRSRGHSRIAETSLRLRALGRGWMLIQKDYINAWLSFSGCGRRLTPLILERGVRTVNGR